MTSSRLQAIIQLLAQARSPTKLPSELTGLKIGVDTQIASTNLA